MDFRRRMKWYSRSEETIKAAQNFNPRPRRLGFLQLTDSGVTDRARANGLEEFAERLERR